MFGTSVSVIICTDPDPSINKPKKYENLDFFFYFLSLKTDLILPSKTDKQKNLKEKIFLLAFCLPLTKK